MRGSHYFTLIFMYKTLVSLSLLLSSLISPSISPPLLVTEIKSQGRRRPFCPLTMKRRNCNLELRLLPSNTDYSTPHHHNMMIETGRGSPQEQQQKEQQLTIFYNGSICVCDVTELQARAILLLASREMEEKPRTPTASDAISPSLQSQLYSPTGLSMKRSLQRFLQKRKNRMEATSPYHR